MLFGTVYSSAAEPYDTYTYSIEGDPLKSPPAYSAIDQFDSIDMKISKLSNVKLSVDRPNPIAVWHLQVGRMR